MECWESVQDRHIENSSKGNEKCRMENLKEGENLEDLGVKGDKNGYSPRLGVGAQG
jgi:hypothetical protein